MSAANETKTHCLCQGTDDGRPMIRCDNCNHWYHFDCIKLDEDTAAEIELFYCEPCSAQTNQSTIFSWQVTDDELTVSPQATEVTPVPKPRAKTRASHPTPIVKQAPSPVVLTAPPTFAVHESDSDGGGKDDDGEYTGERQLTRLRRGRQARQAGSDSDRSPSPDAKARKRKATSALTSTSKRKKTLVAKSPTPLSDPVRKYCYGKLHEVIEPIFLEYRTMEGENKVSDEVAKSLAAKYTAELEDAVFKQYSEPDKKGKPSAGTKYKERFRMLTFNVGQSDRVLLRKGIGIGEISATELSEMSSADLANEQIKQDMEKAAQEALQQSILKEQTALPRAKITHKGEEIIESNTSEDLRAVRDEEERQRVRTHLRVRTGSILQGPESAAMSSAAGMSSSIFGENRPIDVQDGTLTSPDKPFSPDGVPLPTITSPLSPVVTVFGPPVTSSPIQETMSPVDEIGGPSIKKLHTSRPSFDLNALWSNTTRRDSKTDDVVDNDVGVRGDDEGEEAMDLDEDQPGDQDFGMFLDDVEEKNNAVPVPPKSTTPPLSPEEKLETLPTVWSGELIMPLDPNPALINKVAVKQVGGRPLGTSPTIWSLLFKGGRALIEGRVPTERSTKYLLTTRLNSSKELVAVLFEPMDASKGKFTELIDFLIKKDRHGLIFPWGTQPPSSAPGKDLYLVPLPASRPLPEFIDLLDHVQIPKNRDENLLLGVFVLSKGKIVVPPTPVNTPSLVAPSTSAIPPLLQNSAISSLFSALGNAPMMPTGVGPSMSATPVPGLPPMMPPPMQASGMAYPYSQPPPPLPMALPPPMPTPPSTAALDALSASLKNMSQEQINLVLKGLSMANAAPPPMAMPPPVPWASSAPPPPHMNPMYGGAPIPQSYNPYSSPARSPQTPRSPDRRDDHYSRDRDRRASPPLRGRDGRPRDREEPRERGRGGPRDRRGGGQNFGGQHDSGWNRKRAAAPTGHGQGQ